LLALIGALAAMLVGAPAQALAQELAVSDATVAAEGTGTNSSATFTITLSAPAASEVTVSYATASATAVSPGDFAPLGLTLLTFGPGETSKQVVVSVVGDALDEAGETFSLQLSAPSGATISDGIGVATIVDDDPEPVLSVADASVSEGGANLVFTVTLTPVSGRTVTVDYATTDGTATSTGAFDYTTQTGTLTFAPGVTTQTVSVPITQDTLDETDETVLLNLTLPVGSPATISDAQGIGTIIDDDGPTISVDDRTVTAEGATGTTLTVTFTISLSAASVQPVTVRYATAT
jgi:chitinase